MGLDRHVDSFVGAFDVLKSFYTLKQGRDETLENYYKRFEASVESVKLSYGSLTNHEKLTTLTEKDNTGESYNRSFLGYCTFKKCRSNPVHKPLERSRGRYVER